MIISMKKSKFMTKILTLALACAMLCGVFASAVGYDESCPVPEDDFLETALAEYHEQINQVMQVEMQAVATCVTQERVIPITDAQVSADVQNEFLDIQERTVEFLRDNGYEAYDVNPSTYDDVAEQIKTDLGNLGIGNNNHAIIVISGKDDESTRHDVSTKSTASDSFPYIYDGTTYLLRYVTVTAADIPAYGASKYTNLLTSKSAPVIQNCLDTAVKLYASYVLPYGSYWTTIASICGLNISNFSFSQTSTLIFHGNANWTRTFTQVKDTSANTWVSGSYVEYVRANAYLSGDYYSAQTNSYQNVPTSAVTKTVYSSHYYNGDWRNQNGVIGYIHLQVYNDMTGDLSFYYGTSKQFSFHEGF